MKILVGEGAGRMGGCPQGGHGGGLQQVTGVTRSHRRAQSSAQPTGLQRPPRVCAGGNLSRRKVMGSPSPAPPEPLARVGAAQPPCSALLPMAERADLSRRFPAFLPAAGCAGSWGEAAAEQPRPLPSSQPPSPAPPHMDTSGCARRAWTQSGHGIYSTGTGSGRLAESPQCVPVTARGDGGR